MPLPVIADTMRVSAEGLMANGHVWANVLHYRKSGAITFAAAIAILDPLLVRLYSFSFAASSSYQLQQHSSWSLQRFRYTPLDNSTATTVNAHVLAGSNASDPLPPQTCVVATLRTSLRGRSRRGRTYWGPLTEGASANGISIDATVVTRLQTDWNGHLTDLVGSGVSLVVASYKLVLATDVTTVTIDSTWDTQRRRTHP